MHIISEKKCHVISGHATTVAETGKLRRGAGLGFERVPLFSVVVLVWTAIQTCSAAAFCRENQIAELGRQGYIGCEIPDGFRSIYWFDDISESAHVVVTLRKDSGAKTGQGFQLGYYDVQQNGTLVIANVTTWHERMYRAIVYTGVTHETFVISLKVIDSPRNQIPTIQCPRCHQEYHQYYYYSVMNREVLTCSFGVSRPPVQLEWFEQRGDGYERVEMQQHITTENSNGRYHTTATLHSPYTDRSNLIHLLMCNATWPLSDWRREREILLDFSGNISFSDVSPSVQHMEINRYAKIQCGQSPTVNVVWKRILPNSEPEIIGFHSHEMTDTISDIPDVEVSAEGSLIFASPRVHHEGIYVCISGDGQKEEIQMTSLEILSSPGDEFPMIECQNCHQEHHHSVVGRGTLTCSFSAARPPVQLEWFEQRGDGYELVEMQQFHTAENSNGTFDSSATLQTLTTGSNLIHLVMCRSTWSQSDWSKEKEIVVDYSSHESFAGLTHQLQHMEINRYAKIKCGMPSSAYVIWKRIVQKSEPEIIGFLLHGMIETISDIPDVEVSAKGSLVFALPSVQHEGIYVCISGDGQNEEIQMTFVKLLIPPSPPYIQITGCDDLSQRCVIREDSTKKLTCAVYEARPNVTLEWIAEDGDDISFFNHKEVFRESGETFDTILSVEYEVSQDVLCGEEIVIKCHLYGPLSNILKAESTVVVTPAFCGDTELKEEDKPTPGVNVAVIAGLGSCTGLLLIVIAAIYGIICYCRLRNQTNSATSAYGGVSTGISQDASIQTATREISYGKQLYSAVKVGCDLKDPRRVSV